MYNYLASWLSFLIHSLSLFPLLHFVFVFSCQLVKINDGTKCHWLLFYFESALIFFFFEKSQSQKKVL